MKINKIVKLVLMFLITIFALILIPGNKVQAANKLDLKVSYSYNEKKDSVTVKVQSKTKLKNTKPSWKLSKKKYTYIKTFYKNQKYYTTFTDINGKKKNIKIKVNQIKGPKINVNYKYYPSTNKVKVNLQSNKKFADTKSTWTLSKKKYTYTKFYKKNQKDKIMFYDIYGNKKEVNIKIDQIDQTGPKLNVKYDYAKDYKTVLVTITSDEELKQSLNNKWKLSKDKKVYTRTFYTNTKHDIVLKDKYKNKTTQTIDINQIGKSVSTSTTDTRVISANSNATSNNITSNNVSSGRNNKKDVYKGIDVASHQGKINWEDVKNDGIDFAILRCGYGKNSTKQDDAEFKNNLKECERLSIPYGVYLYSYALNTESAKSEAKHVLRLIKGHNPKYGVWFDMEDADGYKAKKGMPSNKELVNICDNFCKYIKQNGYSKVGIYANLDWWKNRINDSKLDIYDKWLARWPTKKESGKTVQTGTNTPPSGENINSCVIWQYTSKGTVNGISGYVDMNYCYKTY